MHRTLPLQFLSLLALSACQIAPGTAPSLAPLTPASMQSPSLSPALQPQSKSQSNALAEAKPQAVKNAPSPVLAGSAAPTKAVSLPVAQPQVTRASAQPVKQAVQTASGLQSIPIASLNIPKGFDYATTQDVQVDIQVKSPNGAPYPKVMVAIYGTEAGLNPLIRGVTDANGRYQDLMRIPGYHRSLQVQVSALGIENFRQVPISNRQITAQFGQ